MNKLLNNFDLNAWYERYSRLVTSEGKKQFNRTVHILGVCVFAVIFIWYCGIERLSLQGSFQSVTQIEEISLPSLQSIQSQDSVQPSVTSEVYNTMPLEQANSSKTFTDQQDEVELENKEKIASESSSDIIQKNTEDITKTEPKYDDYGLVKKTIYMGTNLEHVSLTFDDGYEKKAVEMVLDILKKKNIKSTFFVIGEAIAKHPEVWKRAINEGHQVCNHTNNHKKLTALTDNQIQEEIKGWETTVKKFLGENYLNKMKKEFPFLRFPGGSGGRDARILSIAQKNGYVVVAWNLETYSSIIKPLKKTHTVADISQRIENHVVKKCAKGSIILLHFNQYDVGNLEGMINGIISRGLDIMPVSEIITSQ